MTTNRHLLTQMANNVSTIVGIRTLFLSLFLISNIANAADKPNLIWRTVDWPPMYITAGPDKNTGLYDELLQLYKAALPNYNHQYVPMTTQRALKMMDSGELVCHTSMTQKDANGRAILSDLNSLLLGHKVIYRRELKKDLAQTSANISLEQLLIADQFRVGIASFGTHDFLKKYKEKRNQFYRMVFIPEGYDSLMNMLLRDRVDYIIQYPPVVVYHEKQRGLEGKTASLSISETSNKPYIRVHTACTKNRFGQNIINTVNQVINKARKTGKLSEIQLRWYDTASRKQLLTYYKKEYDAVPLANTPQ